MKSCFFIAIYFLFFQVATAQKELPPFGKIDVADLELKDCSFDPGAGAAKLIDWGSINYTRNTEEPATYFATYERRVRIKIFKESGLSYANLSIPYYSYDNNEKITSISACTYTLTEGHQVKKTVVLKNAVYRRKINKQFSELILVFPDVKAGSVIEYKYQLQCKLTADVKDWFFQSELPCRYSEYQVKIPTGFSFLIHPLTVDSLAIKALKYTDRFFTKSGVQHVEVVQKNFVMRNLRAIGDEPFTGAAKDYLQRLSFRLSAVDYGNGNTVYINSEWEDVVDELLNDHDFGDQLTVASPALPEIALTVQALSDLQSKLAFVHQYFLKNLQWNGLKSFYSFKGIKSTFAQKTGSSGDINLLLIATLQQAGINAKPLLVSTRDNGLLNESLPLIKQFNTVMALVEEKDQFFVLDASDQYSAYNLFPASVVNTNGFVVEADSGRWVQLPDMINKYKVVTAVSGIIDSTGWMKGDVLITSSGYARKRQGIDWIKHKEVLQAEMVTPNQYLLPATLESSNAGAADLTSFEQKLKFNLELGKAGEHSYFKPNQFSELQTNPFTATERHTDVDFGWLQEYRIYGNYIIPQDYEFEELPQNVSLIMPDTSIVFKRFISAENNSLNIVISIDFRRTYYTAAEYAEFAAFYKIFLSKLSEPVSIKKKIHP